MLKFNNKNYPYTSNFKVLNIYLSPRKGVLMENCTNTVHIIVTKITR